MDNKEFNEFEELKSAIMHNAISADGTSWLSVQQAEILTYRLLSAGVGYVKTAKAQALQEFIGRVKGYGCYIFDRLRLNLGDIRALEKIESLAKEMY